MEPTQSRNNDTNSGPMLGTHGVGTTLYEQSISLCSNRQTVCRCSPGVTLGCRYFGARGIRTVATSIHSSDELTDISGSLLLPPTIAMMMGYLTSEDYCYYEVCDTRTIDTSTHNNDRSSNINGLLLLPPTIAIDYLTSENHCYYEGTWHRCRYY
jgi:hypothetical protein